MHNLLASQILLVCFGCCLLLQLAAGAALLFGSQHAPMEKVSGVVGAVASKALLASPGIVVAGLLVQKMNLSSFHPSLYFIGAALSCIFLDLFMHID